MNSLSKLEKVTIGIPFFNAEKYLADAIRSVIYQSYKNWNLILVDDGSTDSSLSIAQAFSSNKILIVSDGERKGLVYRLNQLVELADGFFYARMDADDIMHYKRIEKQVFFLQRNINVDVVGSAYYALDHKNNILGYRKVNLKPNNPFDILLNGCFAHPSVTGRLIWFKNNKYDDSCERMEDLELWLRTISKSSFRNIPEPLLFYRVFGVPVFSKYLKSNIGILKILLVRKKYNLTLFSSLFFLNLYILKMALYTLIYCVGKLDLIVKRRFSYLKKRDQLKANLILKKSLRL